MSIITPNKKKSVKIRCGHCPRVFFVEDEVNQKVYKKDGKNICPVCRATKLSRFSKEISGDKKAYEKDKEEAEDISKARALREVTDVAVASQDRAGDKYRLKK